MRKDCDTCLHDEFGETYCNDCYWANGKPPTKWEPAPFWTPDTNADRIRAMSDEELAMLIVKHHPMYAWNKKVREIYFGFDDHRKDNPQRAWIDWLKQPAEGEI